MTDKMMGRPKSDRVCDTYLASLPPVDAEPVAWMRDLDGTGSLHPASQGDPGSFPVYPAAAIIALQGERDRWEKHATTSDGVLERTRAKLETADAEVARLKAERDELQEALDLRWKADMRAITEWREVTGRELTLPDHIDLVHFLLMGLDLQVSENQKAEAEVARLKDELTKAHRVIELFESFGCPVCGGDCASANPPVMSCPMQQARSFRDGQKTGEKG